MLLTFKTQDTPLNEEAEITLSDNSEQNIVYAPKSCRSVSHYIPELSGACCTNASKLYYGISYSFMIRMKMILLT